MSALGHKQTFAVQNVMSALPPKADICSAQSRCPLCANSGHSAIQAVTSSAARMRRLLVIVLLDQPRPCATR